MNINEKISKIQMIAKNCGIKHPLITVFCKNGQLIIELHDESDVTRPCYQIIGERLEQGLNILECELVKGIAFAYSCNY